MDRLLLYEGQVWEETKRGRGDILTGMGSSQKWRT